MQKPVYFSVADHQLESFIGPELPPESAFERSLILNTLFQPSILIPDIFLFTSIGLESHVNKYKKSLLEACIERNIVIPAFRQVGISTFHEVLHIVRGSGDASRAIQGIRANADVTSNRLQVAADLSPKFSPAFWPTHDVGERFDKVIEQLLMCHEPPNLDGIPGITRGLLQQYWDLTKKWRVDCILEAREETRNIAGKGLRRGEIMNAVGRNLGLPRGHLVHDVADLLSLPQLPREQRALRLFCQWMAECYQYNQAKEFKCSASFPRFEPLDSLMAVSIIPPSVATINLEDAPTIKVKVPHPPIEDLLEMSPNNLLQIRDELGRGYFAALVAWHDDPNETKAEHVRSTLQKYAQALVKWAAKERDFVNAVLDVTHVTKTEEHRQALSSAINIIKATPAEILVVLMEEGYSLFQLYYPKREHREIKLQARDTSEDFLPEVNIADPS